MKEIINEIVNQIKQWDKIAIFNHKGIDGDSLSSSYGLLKAIKRAFPNKEVVWINNEEECIKNFGFIEYDANDFGKEIDNTYLAIIGDTCSKNKVENYEELIKAGFIICFDHHQNDIDIKHNIYWREPNMPASTIQAVLIAQKLLGKNFDEDVAFLLMIGLLTDTGNFRYSLANPDPVEKYANLLHFISNEKMNFFWNQMSRRNKEDIKLLEHIYSNLKFNGQVAYIHFTEKEKKIFGDVNFKDKIHSIGNIDGYPIWSVFVDQEEDGELFTKVHLRSNGPNVSRFAISLGGGGHIRAAGAKVRSSEYSIEKLLHMLNEIDLGE